jgi:hypothetical protein
VLLLAQTLKAAVGGGIGGDRSEEHLLVAQGAEVAERIAAGEHHGEVAGHEAGLVAHLPAVAAQGRDQAAREPQPVGQGGQQGGARARGQGGLLGAHFNAEQRRGSVHLHGDPPERGLRVLTNCIIPAREDL